MYGCRILMLLAVLPLLSPLILARLSECELSAHNHLHFELTTGVLLALSDVQFVPVKERVNRHSKINSLAKNLLILEGLVHYLRDQA